MEGVRHVLFRCAEALFVFQLLILHQVTRLLQRLVELQLNFFPKLFCSGEGDRLATRLVSSLMECYTGPGGKETVDDIREGCPSFYKESSDYKFYLAMECLEKAATAFNYEERETLARDAYRKLSGIPESVDLRAVCQRFEDLRFYEAVVRLPLLKAQTLDPAGNALYEQADGVVLEHALARRERCYGIIISALRSLKGEVPLREFRPSIRSSAQSSLSPADKKKYICQIIQFGVHSSDKIFHEYLYRSLIDLGLEDELLEFGGPDLVPFLQSAGREATQEHQASSAFTTGVSPLRHSGAPTKFLELLARYYVLKRERVLAAHVLLQLAERCSSGLDKIPTLDQRRQYLSSAFIQAKSAIDGDSPTKSSKDGGLLDLLEGKLTVLQFQIRIKQELEGEVSKEEATPSTPEAALNDPMAEYLQTIKEKVKELSLDLKTITQLYNDYAVPFELWEICLEMLYFASFSGDIVRDTWARLMDQSLSKGGIAEACSVLKRIGPHVYPGDSTVLPLDTLCLHLEKAAMDRLVSGVEVVGDEDVARALLAACKGAVEPVLNSYDHLLSNGAIKLSPSLKLRLLRSILVVLREWAVSVGMGTSPMGASRGTFSMDPRTAISRGIRDKITSAANRYIIEVRRLALPQGQIEDVYSGFKAMKHRNAGEVAVPVSEKAREWKRHRNITNC